MYQLTSALASNPHPAVPGWLQAMEYQPTLLERGVLLKSQVSLELSQYQPLWLPHSCWLLLWSWQTLFSLWYCSIYNVCTEIILYLFFLTLLLNSQIFLSKLNTLKKNFTINILFLGTYCHNYDLWSVSDYFISWLLTKCNFSLKW